jgi:hypothetical protein
VKSLFLFLLGSALPGFGGAVGSIVGHRFGATGLWIGGVVGGLVASVAVAWIASRAWWIGSRDRWSTALGTAIGFLIAATIAVRTLSSPVGPVLSTGFAGLGAVIGSRRFGSRPAA